MRTFIKSWTPQCLRILKSPCRLFHGCNRLLTSQMISYYDTVNQCKKELPEYFSFASDVLDEWSQLEKDGRRPINPAFWWVNGEGEEVKWSFEELGFLSRKAANVLSEACGLQRGDRVLAVLPRVPEWWLLTVACMRTGIVFIPGTSQLTAKDILYRLQASKAKCVITNDTLAPAVESVMPDCQFLKSKLIVAKGSRDGWLNLKELFAVTSADHQCVKTRSQDPMLIYFTSGSTGSPKMVVQSHSSYGIGFATSGRHWMNLTPSDIMWNTSDTGWVKSAWGSVFAPWICGSCVFVHNMPQFKPAVIAETLSRYPITVFCTAPTAYRMLVQHDLSSYKFTSLRHCLSGGEALNPEVMAKWKIQTGLDIYEGYGQTETVTICANMKGMEIKPGSLGKAVPPYDVQIIDDHGAILPAGEEGNIAIRVQPRRPFCMFSEYLDNPEKTAASVWGNFYVTGDRGTMDEEGYVWFVGRADDIINSSGYRIGPFEVESALIQHPAVSEAAVVSSPDPVRGEVVKAFVVLAPAFVSHDPEKLTHELQQHVKKVTAPYKYPRKVEFVQDLPKTATGKIQRKVLRNKEWGRVIRINNSANFLQRLRTSSAMKLFKLQTLKSLWTLKPPDRAFHGHARLLVSDVYSQYESIRRGKQEIPKYFNFASDVLDRWSEIEKAGRRPPNPAFWWINGKGDEVKWSFEELGFLSRKVANVLTNVCGLQKGDRIIVILPRIPEWWLVAVACMRAGVVLIPGISQLSAKDILYRLQASKAKCIITSDTLAPAVDSVASECQFLKTKLIVSKGRREGWLNLTDLYKNQSADHSCAKTRIQDPMSIFFTSGTTGSPKMTEHSQGSLGFRPLLSERHWLDSTPSDMIWSMTDTGWILTSVASLLDPWIFGSCIFIHMLPKIESAAILKTLCEFPIETLVGPPTLFRMLVQDDLSSYKFMNLKNCVSGGEPLNPEVMEQWKSKTGLDIREVYGLTETGIVCCVSKGMKIKPGSMGKAVPLYDVQIIDKNANILPPGQQGEIAIRSKPLRPLGLFSGYVDNPKKTAESERGDFYVTGDRAIMDEDGYFHYIGRDDDIIISSGYRIGPFEVESALIEHPAVAETAVVSSPDPLRGEVVKAFVVLSPTFSSSDLESLARDLQEHVKKTTAPYKYPRKVEFVQELPKTVTGKIKRNELRKKEWGRM